MKRFALLAMSFLFALSIIPPMIYAAQGDLTFTANTTGILSVHPGDYIEVPIIITNNPGIAAITGLMISWDSDKLMYDDRLGAYSPANSSAGRQTWPFTIPAIYSDGGIFEGALFLPPAEGSLKTENSVTFGLATISNRTKNGTLITIKFKVKDNANPGAIDIALALTSVVNQNGVALSYNLVNGVLPNTYAPAPSETLPSMPPPDTNVLDPDDILNADKAADYAGSGKSVIFDLDTAIVLLSPNTLGLLSDAAEKGEAVITVEANIVLKDDLRGLQAAQAKEYALIVDVCVYLDGKKVEAPVTVSLPYTLKQGEDPAAVCVWHLDELGKLTQRPAEYDPDTGIITFVTNHQGYFVAGYDPVALWKNIFGDVDANAWYYDAVAYANYYGYIHGDGANYKPDGNLSRAMFATLVWKLEGSPLPAGTASFTDVPDGTWYTDAVLWAAEKSIVQGVGDNQYNPGKPLSRQEMVTLLYNYAVYKQYIIPVYQETSYSDTDSIGAWAEGAAQHLADAGVLNGFIGDAFSPAQTATRAEAAQLFKDFLRLIVTEPIF